MRKKLANPAKHVQIQYDKYFDQLLILHPFLATVPILYLPKTRENLASFTKEYVLVTYNFIKKTPKACSFIKKRLQHRCFNLKFAKFSGVFRRYKKRTLTRNELSKCLTTYGKIEETNGPL